MLPSTPQPPVALPDRLSDRLPVPQPAAHWPPFWGRLETLWLLMAPLCALLYTLCLPLAPNDLWYHVRAGELISRGAIPTQNLMSSAVPLNAPYYYQSWLAELALFATLKLGGLAGLTWLRAFCVAGALGLVASATFRALLRLPSPLSRLGAARLTALSAVLGLAMASNNVDLRPQTFSTLFFGAWIFAVLEFRTQSGTKRGFWGAFLVVLTLIWANTHGAFILSILGLLTLSCGDFWWRRAHFSSALGVAMGAGAAALVNPRGAALYAYVASLSRNPIGQQWVQEWKSPGFEEWHSLLFWGSAAAILASALLAWRRKNQPSEANGLVLVLAIFGVMAARDQRSIIWFALLFVPVFAGLVAGFLREKSSAPAPRGAQWINAFLLIFLLALPLAFSPHIKPNWPWPREFQRRFAPTPALFGSDPQLLLENTTPVAPAQWLLAHPPTKRLFTDMVCGSYLTYAGRGHIVPLCDPRIELFPDAFWKDYLQLSSGPANAAAILETRGFSDALLDRDTMPGLVRRLRAAANWRLVAQTGSTVLFRRSNAVSPLPNAKFRAKIRSGN